ncbi:MAG: RNA methyltransferase [Clostridia bacterium]|nr:RNA methyltransferase [Clostridia bacterium]
METITSNKNQIVQKTIDIKKNGENLLLLENIKLICEAKNAGHKVKYVLIEKKKFDYFKTSFHFVFEGEYHIVSESVLSKICDTKSPQGIVAVVEFHSKIANKIEDNFLVLENLQDPGNVGTIIRSASGTSFKNIFLINCVSFLNQKVVRSTMGGIFRENLFSFKSLDEFLKYFKDKDFPLIVADMCGENLFEMKKMKEPFGLVIGNEGNGVSCELKKLATKTVSIPMKNGLESLNAGVSCSIITYFLDNLK